MSLWSSFLDNIAKPVGRAIESTVKGVGEGFAAAGITPNASVSPSNALASPIIKAGVQMTVPKITSAQGLDEKVQQEIAKNIEYVTQEKAVTGDIVLKVANEVVAPIISKGITRPIATFGLVTDFNSPLYQPGKYERGFQLNDIKAAYNRTEEVSAMQALTKSDLMRVVNPVGYAIQDAVFSKGNIDIEKVNLWDNQDIKKNFSDNIVGKIYTGAGDFALVNAAITAVGGGVGVVAKSFGKMAGLTTTGKSLATYADDIDAGLEFINTNGASGRFTNAGNDVKRLADSKNVDEVVQILDSYTTNPLMIDTILDVTDVNIVKDLLLADKGDLGAINRLINENPAVLGEISDVKSSLRNKAVDNGGVYHPEGDNLDRINALYDDAIKLPEHKKYYETVMDPLNKSPRSGGRDYTPVEPRIGAERIARVGERISSARAASVSRDFTDIGGFTERLLGNRLVTRAISFTGTYKPLGYVTFSGARPLDGMVELDAIFDDMAMFKDGTNLIRVSSKEGDFMKASDYRTAVKTNFIQAESNIKRQELLKALDEQLGRHIAYTNGFFDDIAIDNFTRELRGQISTSHAMFSERGMGIDAQGRRTTVDPYTQRQLVESYRMAPWSIIEKEIIEAAKNKVWQRTGAATANASKAIFETVNRYWTFDVLARPSYIPKNSLAEPALSAFLAQGIGYIVESIPTFAKNSIKNNRNRTLGLASRVYNGPALKSIQKVVDNLTEQLDTAVGNLNLLNAEADTFFMTGDVSPAAIAGNGAKVAKAVRDAEALVDSIELELLSAAKPFGRIPQVPTFARLEQRINFLENSTISSSKPKVNNTVAYDNLTESEFRDVERWVTGEGSWVNSYKRSDWMKSKGFEVAPVNPENIAYTNALEKIINKTSVVEDVTVYRGIKVNEYTPYNDLKVGDVVTEPGFSATSKSKDVAIPFAQNANGAYDEIPVLLEIRVPSGHKGIDVEEVYSRFPNKAKSSSFSGTEGEIILGPTKFKVVEIIEGLAPGRQGVASGRTIVVEAIDSSITKTTASASGRYGVQIANARAALAAAKAEIHTLLPNPAGLLEKNKEIAKQYEIIDDALKSLGEVKYQEALVLGKGAEYKKRFYGKEDNYRMVDGVYTRIDSLFDENQYGAAMREELANAQTVSTTYLNETAVGTRQSVIMRKTPNTITDVNSPLYFEELAYVANRTMRGDPLIDQILSGVEFTDLVKWGQSPAGIAYMEQFGGHTLGNVPDFIRHRISFVNRYLPNKVAQDAVLKGEVTSVQLQEIMGRDLDVLSAIHPTEFNYNAAAEGFIRQKEGLARIDAIVASVARRTFKALAAPENPIRWSFADKVFLDTMAKKANALSEQGVEMTMERMNALRQSATREAVEETEKTFYTIRRQNRAAYTMRMFTAFPSASLNAVYRYGRFAIKNPTRATGFLNGYNSMFTTFGIDKYGNPVQDAKDATHIVMPLTKELGLFGDKGVRISARSVGFLVNTPGPSFFMAVPIAAMMAYKPSTEETLKSSLGSYYDVIFPYGPQTSITQALTPGWIHAGTAYVTGNESRTDFLNSVKSVMNYYYILDSMGIQKFPGMARVRDDARNLYLRKALWTFASPLGAPIKVDTDPLKLYDDYHRILVEKYLSKGLNRIDAKERAGFEMLATLGADFPLDNVTYKGVSQKAYIPAQLENYNRVFVENNDLVTDLVKQNPKMVTLLTLDVPVKTEDFNLSIYRILNNPKTKLPGNVLLNELALSPEQEQTERVINRTQADFNKKRDELQSLAYSQKKRTLAAAGLDVELERYAKDVLAEKSPEWFYRYNNPQFGDNSFAYANALQTVVNNSKFMAKHGQSKLWQDTLAFLRVRNVYTNIFQALDNGDPRKTQIRNTYNTILAENLSQWDPALQELITRNFLKDTMKTTQVGIK